MHTAGEDAISGSWGSDFGNAEAVEEYETV
jgi:hypothetical protein